MEQICIVEGENGTRVTCNNCANRAGNVHELCTAYLRGGLIK